MSENRSVLSSISIKEVTPETSPDTSFETPEATAERDEALAALFGNAKFFSDTFPRPEEEEESMKEDIKRDSVRRKLDF